MTPVTSIQNFNNNILGNLYSEHLRDTITACIQTDRMARPDITQIRLKCEQMLQVFDKWTKNYDS